MREVERSADAAGLTYDQMMQHAGKAMAQSVISRAAPIRGKQVLVLAGSGNNGGDGLVAAGLLADEGAQVAVYLTKDRGQDDPHLASLRERGVFIAVADQDQRSRVLKLQVGKADILLDAVLGTGFRLPLQGAAQVALRAAKQALEGRQRPPLVVAVDCPSGLDCDSGEAADEAIPADLTVTLAAAKPGLFRPPGAALVGDLVVGEIGLASDHPGLASVELEVAEAATLRSWLPERPRAAHKGTFGRVLLVAGSIQFPGAAALAGKSAYLVGAGLVTLGVPALIQPMIAGLLPEVTWIPLPHEDGALAAEAAAELRAEWPRTQAVLLGPGFGLSPGTRDFLAEVLGARRSGRMGFLAADLRAAPSQIPLPPCVIDADGLKLLAEIEGWQDLLPPDSVLTPHPGEMSILSGESTEVIQADRLACATRWAEAWGKIVVLKGAYTVVAAGRMQATVIPIASPALARAGTGDVLAGAVAGLLAQGLSPYRAAVLGAYLHGRAGILAAGAVGNSASVLAGDVAAALPQALNELAG
jgi:NAD(P)H-hydrate epimerase